MRNRMRLKCKRKKQNRWDNLCNMFQSFPGLHFMPAFFTSSSMITNKWVHQDFWKHSLSTFGWILLFRWFFLVLSPQIGIGDGKWGGKRGRGLGGAHCDIGMHMRIENLTKNITWILRWAIKEQTMCRVFSMVLCESFCKHVGLSKVKRKEVRSFKRTDRVKLWYKKSTRLQQVFLHLRIYGASSLMEPNWSTASNINLISGCRKASMCTDTQFAMSFTV